MNTKNIKCLIGGIMLSVVMMLGFPAVTMAAELEESPLEEEYQEKEEDTDVDEKIDTEDSEAHDDYYISNDKFYCKYDDAQFKGTGFVRVDGVYYYLIKGVWNSSYQNFVKVDNIDDYNGEIWYVQKGKADFSYNSIRKYKGDWWKVTDGKIDTSYTGVAKNENGWWRVENGKVNFNFNGFAENQNGWWYLQDGKVKFDKTDVIKGKVNGQSGWWHVVRSQVKFIDTVAKNKNGWWKITDGKVDFAYSGVAKNNSGWWRIENGKVNFDFNGFAQNHNGWWYLKNGKVGFDKTDIMKATIDGKSGWWYVKKSKVMFIDTVAKNAKGWWRIENGRVNFNFNGFAENQNGWWYITDGQVRFGTNSVLKGTVNGQTAWWYVCGGKVLLDYNGIGINNNGIWYIENGKVDFTFNGTKEIDGVTFDFINGQASDFSGWLKVSGKYYYYENGKKKTNCIVDGYKLDANGYSATRTSILDIVNSHTNAAMTDDKKIETLWNWLVNNSWTYTRTYEHTSSSWVWYTGWTDDFARQCITNKSGNCFRYAAVFGYMVKEATGYKVRVYHGMTPSSRGGTTPHGWTTVYINGTWYAYDPDLYKFNARRSTYYKTPYSTTSKSIHLQGKAANLY